MPPRSRPTQSNPSRQESSRGRGGGRVGSTSGIKRNTVTSPRIQPTRRPKRQKVHSNSERQADSSDSDSKGEEDDFQPDFHSDSDTDSDEDSNKEESQPLPRVNRPRAPGASQAPQALQPPTSSQSKSVKHKIDLENYHSVGLEIGQAQADELLAQQPTNNNTPSDIGMFEAEALQAQYLLDQTMLCVYLGLPLQTLKKHL